MSDGSTRYSQIKNQESADPRRDAWEAVFGARRVSLKRPKTALERIAERAKGRKYRLTMKTAPPATGAVLPIPKSILHKHQQRNDVGVALGEALEVLKTVAGADLDQARQLNGVGFSKADTMLGHRLSAATVDQAMSDRTLAKKIIAMALRYSRQAFQIQTHGLF